MNLLYPNEEIQRYLPDIIDAYIDYFGAEHEIVIREKFKNMVFIAYTKREILGKYYEENKDKEDLGYMKDYLNACERENRDIQLDQIKDILKNESVFGEQLFVDVIYNFMGGEILNGCASQIFLRQDNELTRIPIVYLDNPCLKYELRDRFLIHEINHQVETSHEIQDNSILIYSGMKRNKMDFHEESGKMRVDIVPFLSEQADELNEYLNDRISYEIYSRLKEKNINILDSNQNWRETKYWHRNIVNMEQFFKDYEETIKLSRLYNNLDMLLDEMGVLHIKDWMNFLYTNYGVKAMLPDADTGWLHSSKRRRTVKS